MDVHTMGEKREEEYSIHIEEGEHVSEAVLRAVTAVSSRPILDRHRLLNPSTPIRRTSCLRFSKPLIRFSSAMKGIE